MQKSAAARFILWLDSGEGKRDEEQALQAHFAAGGVVPLAERVRTATLPSSAERNCGNALRKRNVRVSRTSFQARAVAEEAVHVSDCLDERRIVRNFSRGARAERPEAHLEQIVGGMVRSRLFAQAGLHGIAQRGFHSIQLGILFGAQINFHGGARGNGVDRCAAFDRAEIVRAAGLVWNVDRGEFYNAAREGGDRIRRAKIGPAVPARADDTYL